MKNYILGILIFFPLTFGQINSKPNSPNATPNSITWTQTRQEDCGSSYLQLTEDEDWVEQLVNPTLIMADEILGKLDLYSVILDCLESYPDSFGTELKSAQWLIELYLAIIGGYDTPPGTSTLSLVSFSTSDDPAVEILREEIGLPPPIGYVFIRYYASREVMPDIIEQYFQDEDVAGVTVLSRYVAILEDKDPNDSINNPDLSKVFSHELVHAYVNSTTGRDNYFEFPLWYAEGLAIFISGSGEGHAVYHPDGSISLFMSQEDYAQYDLNFKYLEAQYGHNDFLDKIKQSLDLSDPTILAEELGIFDENDLVDKSNKWRINRSLLRLGFFLISAALLIYILWRLSPTITNLIDKLFTEVKCQNCGYRGHEREFIDDQCPNCGHLYHKQVPYKSDYQTRGVQIKKKRPDR